MSPSAADAFHAAVAEWFRETFPGPTRAQRLAWPEIQAGRSTLVLAPTGSGKTLAAFLAAIDRLMFAPPPPREARCRVLYVSPLKALAVDVERNLRAPLAGIARVAARRGESAHPPQVAIRTGDTPQAERARIRRAPPDVLITTPESLFLLLSSGARELLRGVAVAIVDEIHALSGSKRGAHLALSLERVAELAGRPLQRIGLSATQRPLDEVARYLGGGEGARPWRPRPVSVVDAGSRKAFDLRIEVPVEDMSRPGDSVAAAGRAAGDAAALVARHSIWPQIHPRLLELVRAHRSTILFVNARRLAERIAAALNELAGEELVRAHHGSIAREERLAVEEALKAGRLRALVATSSLELGIDMGAVDLVIQIETPPSVASGMQRIGRAGHQAGAVSTGVLFPKYRGDLLAAAAVARAMRDADVEPTRIPRNPLDVLAQHLVSMVLSGERRVDELYALARRAAPFAALPRALFDGTLDMLAGRYPSEAMSELRPRLVWDRARGRVRAREGARGLVVTNAGTIPDRGLYGVFLADGEGPGRRVGELDEEMVFESRVGEVFVLGASSWRITEITRDRVLVLPAPGEPGKMPFWKADRGGRPIELGRAIGRLTRELAALPPAAARRRLEQDHGLDARAADNLLAYLAEQRAATDALPDDRTIVLERTRDEMGDWRLCLLSPLGSRVHAPWAIALLAKLRGQGEPGPEAIWSDDGIVLRLPDRERPPDAASLLPDPDAIEELLMGELGGTALFAGRFREAAARALLLPRRRPGQRTPLWMQRKRAADLLTVAARYPSFPIVLETYRECLQDVFDLPGLLELARGVRRREVRLVTVDTLAPSPFSASLLFGYVANYLYEGDAPLAERRAQALSVDQRQLRELLGEAELRELLDGGALADLELRLQCLAPERRARSADRVHDLLLRLGDLSREELRARSEPPEAAAAWAAALAAEGRAVRVVLAGEERLVAAEDAARYRDAFGVALPPGLPEPLQAPVLDALEQVVARYARTRGPFAALEPARRFGADAEAVEAALVRLAAGARVLEGEFRPGGHGREWCDAGVLASLRRASLARLRRAVEPAEPEALARLLLDWHGITSPVRRAGPEALLEVVEQLQGCAVPASVLEGELLPARLPGYRPGDLDALTAAGEVVWVGAGALGERDGRVALYLAEDLPLLLTRGDERPDGPLHRRLREHLVAHGASFFDALHAAAGGGMAQPVVDALWDLVWAGEATSDTLAALRAFLAARASRGPSRRLRVAAFRSRRAVPPAATGRFALVPQPEGSPTERGLARAVQAVARHGVLTRDAVSAEGHAGGFAALYPVLRSLEESGRVRRGYFVQGLGASQFADPGAVDRLRALRQPDPDVPAAVVLAASDPANPYGAALPWPRSAAAARPSRSAGQHLVLVDGGLAALVMRNGAAVAALLPDAEPERERAARATATALAGWARRTGRTILGWESAPPLARSPLAPFLSAAGFELHGPGVRLREPAPALP
jgi:ATP-dependent Lhr-like helicase